MNGELGTPLTHDNSSRALLKSEFHSACTIHMGAEAEIHSESVQGTDQHEWLGKIEHDSKA
jgi:hypothetical protein